MGIDNVKLWFAKNENDEIVTIDDLKDSNTYLCPVCGSDLIPKATESKRITPHFAHVDKSKCNNESMMHFWFKHKFLEPGDKFKVLTNKEIEYVCKDVLVEQQYDVGDKVYRPDVTIITECGKTIYFEMNYSNKKEVKDYIDIWLELKNIVVEIDIKQLMNKDSLPSFKALFYEGKCFNVKKNDTYYNVIGKYKEELYKNEINNEIKDRVRKLDWFWRDVLRYKKGEIDISILSNIIDNTHYSDKKIVYKILKKPSCSNIMYEHESHKLDSKYTYLSEYIKKKYGESLCRYLNSHLDHVKIPFVGSWYECKISLEDLRDGRPYFFDFTNDDRTEDVIKKIDIVIPMNKQVEEYNKKSLILDKKLKNNDLYIEINNYVKHINHYDFSCEVSDYEHGSKKFDEFRITVNLKYKNRKIAGCNFNRKFKSSEFSSKVDLFFEEAFIKIKHYFEEVRTLNNLDGLKNVHHMLNEAFSDFNISFTGEEYYEDVFLIAYDEKYYITNNSVFSDVYKKEKVADIVSISDIMSCVKKDVEREIIRKNEKRCIDCGYRFHLEFGELKFFMNKGFTLPKRCKFCRKERKQFKGRD